MSTSAAWNRLTIDGRTLQGAELMAYAGTLKEQDDTAEWSAPLSQLIRMATH